MIWVTHPTGNVFVRALLSSLAQGSMPFEFHTALGFDADSKFPSLLPAQLRGEVTRRSYPLSPKQLHAHPWREAGRLLAGRLGLSRFARHEEGMCSIDAVLRDLDRTTAAALSRAEDARRPHTIHGYEDGICESFRVAKRLGIACSYELPIAYWETSRRLLEEEARRLPDWEPTLFGTRDSVAKLERKTEELALADTVVCPSRFVYDSLPTEARQQKPCIVAEFGSPPSCPQKPRADRKDRSLRVLFAGSMSQRKGLADVFAAMRLVSGKSIELVVMGSPLMPMQFYRAQYRDFRYEPPRAHREFVELMTQCDLLVLPSIVEGRALVQQEAMSCGLPIVITPNTGGEDLVVEGETGFLVPIRSPESIAEKVAWCADHREQTAEMGMQARLHAAAYTWEKYTSRILELVAGGSSPSLPCSRVTGRLLATANFLEQ